jgi:hypothetical protein
LPWIGGGVALVACLALGQPWSDDRRVGTPDPSGLEGSVLDLADHLGRRGLELRVVPTGRGRPRDAAAFLTTTDKSWSELNVLPQRVEAIDRWRGTVFCERVVQSGSRDNQVELWGNSCLVAGPFLFFGDRDLLDRIRDTL